MSGLNKQKVIALKNAFVSNWTRRELFVARHKKKLYRRLAAFSVLALIIIGGLGSTLMSQFTHLEEKQKQKEEAQATLAELKKQQKQYEEELERLNDDEYIAELARKNYFLSDEGEIIFNIPETEEKGEKARE
ncbi:septum formation initiator family protein [Bacillus sp. REN10]|uniref:FtsB family cell division protein n=1 Tax=Bacillus sp. REN10 TaxID=2782541 RepID=UPI00193B0BEB|nr:septum formation initiator family protein [Bacillus sp. REN10]